MTEHLDAAIVGRYLTGTATSEERARLDAHLAECPGCRLELVEVRRILATAPRRRSRLLVPLAAAAAAVLLVWTGSVWRAPHASPTRDSAPSAHAFAPQPLAPLGNVAGFDRLVWSAVPGASRYRVTLFTSEGQPAWRATTADTFVTLPDTVHLAAQVQHYWQVKAEAAYGRWIESELVAFTITQAGARQ